MTNNQKLPLRIYIFAGALIAFSLLGIGVLGSLHNDKTYGPDFSVFVIVIMLSHLIVAIAVLSKKRWGFWIFKSYLCLLYIAIPFGTYIAHKTFLYIRDNEIAKLYK